MPSCWLCFLEHLKVPWRWGGGRLNHQWRARRGGSGTCEPRTYICLWRIPFFLRLSFSCACCCLDFVVGLNGYGGISQWLRMRMWGSISSWHLSYFELGCYLYMLRGDNCTLAWFLSFTISHSVNKIIRIRIRFGFVVKLPRTRISSYMSWLGRSVNQKSWLPPFRHILNTRLSLAKSFQLKLRVVTHTLNFAFAYYDWGLYSDDSLASQVAKRWTKSEASTFRCRQIRFHVSKTMIVILDS